MEVLGQVDERFAEVLTDDALAFVAELHNRYDDRRRELLAVRPERRRRLDFMPETRELRDGEWQVAPVPPDLRRRRVEITAPTDAKMVRRALDSGADGFMADFEDANSPTWENMIGGQANLTAAIEQGGDATLLVRPRGWHLPERHLQVAGEPVAGALVDFGLYFHHNARRLMEKGSGPYFYLPKLESHLEARLWNDVFTWSQREYEIPHGTIKATVLIETLPAAFEMEEILYELRDHSGGLNAGRWDYIFSTIKCRPDELLPDRAQVTMTVPFMRAYTELLVTTCHRRGAHAIGGMAAFIPSRRDPSVNERAVEQVRADKRREADDGFDGTWVAHPDLVEVAMEQFEHDDQLDRRHERAEVGREELLDVASAGGEVTEDGLRANVSVAIRYMASWLSGQGAATIDNLMEDAATAEIARAQVWQWVRAGRFDADRIRELAAEVDAPAAARELFEEVALSDELEDFFTGRGYVRLI